jgi:hypothetical protein
MGGRLGSMAGGLGLPHASILASGSAIIVVYEIREEDGQTTLSQASPPTLIDKPDYQPDE